MSTMYERAALEAALMASEGTDPREAWDKSISGHTNSKSVLQKQCPRSAFLGLCAEGLVIGVQPAKYTTSRASKNYAVKTINFLKEGRIDPENFRGIESLIMSGRENGDQGEIEVAIVLWNNNMIM